MFGTFWSSYSIKLFSRLCIVNKNQLSDIIQSIDDSNKVHSGETYFHCEYSCSLNYQDALFRLSLCTKYGFLKPSVSGGSEKWVCFSSQPLSWILCTPLGLVRNCMYNISSSLLIKDRNDLVNLYLCWKKYLDILHVLCPILNIF